MMEIKRVIAFVIILPVLISLAAFSGSASAPESTNLTQSLVNTTAEKHPDFLLDKSILRLVMEKDMLEKEEIIITNNIDDDIRVAVEENMGFLSAESLVVIEKRREISLSLNFLSNETNPIDKIIARITGVCLPNLSSIVWEKTAINKARDKRKSQN